MCKKICSFFGHHQVDVTDALKKRTTEEIERAIEEGCLTFYFGALSEFDDLCFDIVSAEKEKRPELGIERVLVMPQYKALRKPPWWSDPRKYDDVIYLDLDFEWWYTCIYYRNCAMIDNSELVIFYAEERKNSGAYKAYKYAIKKHKRVVNLFEKSAP